LADNKLERFKLVLNFEKILIKNPEKLKDLLKLKDILSKFLKNKDFKLEITLKGLKNKKKSKKK
jgi:hypothetical protein